MLQLLRDSFKIRKYRRIEGFLAIQEAAALYHYSSLLGPGSVVVEIGSWKGRSTYCIAQGLRNGVIHAIDPFDASGEVGSARKYQEKKGNTNLIDQFNQNLRMHIARGAVQVWQGLSRDYAGTFGRIDMLFIDGSHALEDCLFDFEGYSPAVKVGGYVMFHDYYRDREDLGPTWVVQNRLVGSKGWSLIGQYGSLIAFMKTENSA